MKSTIPISGHNAMFLAAIDYLFEWRMERIRAVLDKVPEGVDPLNALVEDVANNLGKHELHRIIHAALSEIHDAEIKNALTGVYRHNHDLILKLLAKRRDGARPLDPVTDKDAAWGLMGMVTMMNLASDLELLGPRQRKQVFKHVARVLLGLTPD